MASQSEKFFELFDGQSSVARNTAHSESINRIVPRNRYDANAIRHNDVFALAHDAKASLCRARTASR
jgi:hypothetical protein